MAISKSTLSDAVEQEQTTQKNEHEFGEVDDSPTIDYSARANESSVHNTGCHDGVKEHDVSPLGGQEADAWNFTDGHRFNVSEHGGYGDNALYRLQQGAPVKRFYKDGESVKSYYDGFTKHSNEYRDEWREDNYQRRVATLLTQLEFPKCAKEYAIRQAISRDTNSFNAHYSGVTGAGLAFALLYVFSEEQDAQESWYVEEAQEHVSFDVENLVSLAYRKYEPLGVIR